MKWLDNCSAEYEEKKDKWRFTWEVYTGMYSDDKHIKRYLYKRAFNEDEDAYRFRMNSTDPDLSLFTIISSIVGQAMSSEEDDNRLFEDEEFATIMEKLWEDIDGEGTNYLVHWKKAATKQLVFQDMYVLVEGIETDGDDKTQEARIKLISPDMVLAEGDGWIKVKHSVMVGTGSPDEEQKSADQYTIYGLDGWQRWEKVEDGEATLIGEGEYAFFTSDARTKRMLPIYRVSLPFPTYIAHYLARKVVVLFNMDSCIDTYVLQGTSTTLVDDADVMSHEMMKDDLQADERHLNHDGKMYYIAPPEGPAKMGSDRVAAKRKELHRTALQQFGDAAKMSTATEIRYKSKSGIEAFLTLFVTTLEEAEQKSLFLLEQVYFPEQPSRWGQARVTRSKKFQVLDPTEMLKMILEIVFGANALPFTEDMILTALKTVWIDHLGYQLTEEQETALEGEIGRYLEQKQGTSRASVLSELDALEL